MDRKQYLIEYRKKWRKDPKNKEKHNAWNREYYHRTKSPELQAKKVIYNRNHRLESRLSAIKYYGNKCACCDEKQIEFLAIDHINGGGNEHRKEMGKITIGQWLKNNNYPKGFQVLCHNCNMAKSIYGKCPHKTT